MLRDNDDLGRVTLKKMRTADTTQHTIFSYRSLEERIPAGHPLRKLRVLVDGILVSMNDTFAKLYSHTGRPGIPAELLLRTSLLQVFFSIRSERQLVQHIEYNLFYRWFVGVSLASVSHIMKLLGLSAQKPLYQAWQQDATLVRAWEAEIYPAIRAEAKPRGQRSTSLTSREYTPTTMRARRRRRLAKRRLSK